MAGRASNGESTIYKGADGRWHGYVSVGYKLNGKPDRRHVTDKTRIAVVELHNHSVDEQPRLFYMHFWATGDATGLARSLRPALDATNLAS